MTTVVRFPSEVLICCTNAVCNTVKITGESSRFGGVLAVGMLLWCYAGVGRWHVACHSSVPFCCIHRVRTCILFVFVFCALGLMRFQTHLAQVVFQLRCTRTTSGVSEITLYVLTNLFGSGAGSTPVVLVRRLLTLRKVVLVCDGRHPASGSLQCGAIQCDQSRIAGGTD